MSKLNAEFRNVMTLPSSEDRTRSGEASFLRLKDGRILHAGSRFQRSSHDHGACNLFAVWSADEGETWTEPVDVLLHEDVGAMNVMSVSLLEMKNGDTGMFYIAKITDGHDKIMLARSKDGGETWYSHTECTIPARAGYYVLNNDRVIRLASGRIVAPLAYMRSTAKAAYDARCMMVFLLSDDDGETWREAKDMLFPPFSGGEQGVDVIMPAGSESGLQEPGVVELEGGVVQAYFRTDKMYHYEAYSFDGGNTWTKPQPSRFTGPNSPLLIKNVDGGRRFAVWNPAPMYNGRGSGPYFSYGGRTPLVIAEYANGAWTDYAVLGDDPDKAYMYPSMIAVEGGLLVSYMFSDGFGISSAILKIAL